MIAFSNARYYDGKLYTFPSVDDRLTKVTHIALNGVYDKGSSRNNKIEADAIVQEVIRRLCSEELCRLSIGVVAFSQAQQNLIEDCLMEALSKTPDLEALAFQREEPIFVKNLENVQGDERDVILFSIGYGPDKNGQVSMNFGPLNNLGGERRLNVAVSRARYEMMVFSSLRSDQIDLKRSKAKGVEGLKLFLEFAERGHFATPASAQQEQPSVSIAQSIADALKARGHKVQTRVGRSNFKIDVAIVDPQDDKRYILGLLCDGSMYYATKTSRDREIVQPAVLKMLQWHIMRIWTVDWFENPRRVVERIEEKLQELSQSLEVLSEEQAEIKAFDPQNETVVENVNTRLRPYTAAGVPTPFFLNNLEAMLKSPVSVKDILCKIIREEQPVTNTFLYKRIAKICGISRVTSRLQTFIEPLLSSYLRTHQTEQGYTLWADAGTAEVYCHYRQHNGRDIQDIPIIELMNALRYVLETQGALPLSDLKKQISQVLGFARCGVQIDTRLGEVIRQMGDSGELSCQEEMVILS